MCGRYVLQNAAALKAECRRVFGISFDELEPRYNVAPAQLLPVVAADASGRPRADRMRWGLVPFWEKSEKPKFAPINARSETALEKRMFQQSIQRRRCAIPADAFYEWKKMSRDGKQPYVIRLKQGKPFFFAGIYEAGTEKRSESFLLFTTRPNPLMVPIHDRMPAILEGKGAADWVRPGPMSPEKFSAFMEPVAADRMEAFPVSVLVNNPRNDRPECVEPLAG